MLTVRRRFHSASKVKLCFMGHALMETGRAWVYVRDDRPFGGKDPPAGLFYASRDRTREHPERHLAGYAGILQADAFDGYNRLYLPNRKPGPIVEALCWSNARRKFFELADIAANARRSKTATPISPIAFEAVRRIDALFDIEREINGLSAAGRLAVRQERSAPLVAALEGWMCAERAKLSQHNAVAKAIDYMLTRWQAFTRFLDDGRIYLSNNAAERALRGLALGRKSWLFAGSERGAERAALMYTLIHAAKLNDVEDVLRLPNFTAFMMTSAMMQKIIATAASSAGTRTAQSGTDDGRSSPTLAARPNH